MLSSARPHKLLRQILFCSSALALWPLSPANAIDVVIADGEIVFVTQTLLNDGDTLTVEPGGTIDTSGTPGANGASAENNNQTVTNGGDIFAAQHGIRSTGTGNTIINTGFIDAGVHGIRIDGGNTTVRNTGHIESVEHGMRSETADNSSLINEGSIFAGIHGINSLSASETISNSGYIDAGDVGIRVTGSGTEVTNNGTVIGTASIFFDPGAADGILNLHAGSVLDGIVGFGSNPTLNIGSGLNLYLAYQGTDPTVNSAVPHVHDAVNDVIYTIDPTGFALSQSFIQTTASAVHGAVQSGTGFGNSVGGGFSGNDTFAYGANAPGFADEGPRGWASGFGGYQSQDGSGNVTGGDQAYGGLVTGGGFASSDRMYGAFAGGSYSRLETDFDTQRIDAASVYGGVYGGMAHGANWISANFVAGYTSFDSDRTVANNMVAGGLETASADYDGYFISPSLTFGRSIGERTEISFGGNYAGLFLDGYSETGSSANLTVSSRDVHLAALRAQVKYLAYERPSNGGRVSIETWAGIDGYFNLGGDDVTASVAGLPFDGFSASFADSAAIGFAGIGINHKPVSGNWHFNGSLEGRYGTDDYGEIRATASVGRTF